MLCCTVADPLWRLRGSERQFNACLAVPNRQRDAEKEYTDGLESLRAARARLEKAISEHRALSADLLLSTVAIWSNMKLDLQSCIVPELDPKISAAINEACCEGRASMREVDAARASLQWNWRAWLNPETYPARDEERRRAELACHRSNQVLVPFYTLDHPCME